MNKLLRANFGRLRKDKIFWICAIFMAVYALLVCLFADQGGRIERDTIVFDSLFVCGYGFGQIVAVPGLVMAVLVSLFVGTEYSDGTLRNKLIVGRTRIEIYVSSFLTCAAAGVMLSGIYIVVSCAVGMPMYGGFQMEAGALLLLVLDGTLAIVAYTAVFHMVSMLIGNKTATAVITLLGVMVIMFVACYLLSRLSAPEYYDGLIMIDGAISTQRMPNDLYLRGGARTVTQFIVDLLPSGQCLQISNLTALHPDRMPLYSLGIIAVVNAVGAMLFRKKDLK